MLVLKDSGRKTIPEDPDDPDSDLLTIFEPFDLVISTWGGIAMDMFAIYDALRMIKRGLRGRNNWVGKGNVSGCSFIGLWNKGKEKNWKELPNHVA